MANIDSPYGLRLVSSEGKELRLRKYVKKAGAAIFAGDPVKADATGTVTPASAGGAIVGVAMEYKNSDSTDEILICDDPNAIYEIQASAQFAQADVFSNADLTTGSGNTSLRRSTYKLDSASFATTGTLQLKVLGLSDIGTNAFGSYARALVQINAHVLGHGPGVTGV